MSMPSFPPNGADLTREQALTMIVASIAMEELALSHIMNVEGEKLQYILGTLPGQSQRCVRPQDILAVNKSIATVLDTVLQNQMLLKNKLERVLEAGGGCPPSCMPPSCMPSCCMPSIGGDSCVRSSLQLVSRRTGFLWNNNCYMPWRIRSQQGDNIRWSDKSPAWVRLNPEKGYLVQYTVNVCARAGAQSGSIALRTAPCGVFTEALPLYFNINGAEGTPQTLQYTAVLTPQARAPLDAEFAVLLSSRTALHVERASLSVAEL